MSPDRGQAREVAGELTYAWLGRLVNASLRDDPDTLLALAELTGKVLALEFEGAGIRICICPGPEGLTLSPEHAAGAHVSIRGKPGDLVAYLMASRGLGNSFAGNLTITGDIALAQKFQAIMKDFEFDWEARLATFTGDLAARRVANLLRDAVDFTRRASTTLRADLSEYLRHEQQVLPNQETVSAYSRQVRELAEVVAKLEQRIARLQLSLREKPRC
jgi:ubiquinone biosynthesis protein UbiJ